MVTAEKMEKVEELSVKKFRRKIRIKLVDSNDPDSYVCEIFDSSLENDESSESIENKTSHSDVKSYFEVLMSNEFRKNARNDACKENHDIISKNKKSQNNSGKSKSDKPKANQGEIKNFDIERKKSVDSDSSDNESLFEVRKKCVASNILKTQQKLPILPKKVVNSEIRNGSKPQLDCSKNSFLNLFSKTQMICQKSVIKTEKVKNLVTNSSVKEPPSSKNTFLTELIEKQEIRPINGEKKSNVKLAPVFLMREKKAVDLAVQKARYDFLHKETKLLKVTDKSVESVIEFRPVCHVQQRDSNPFWSIRKFNVPTPPLPFIKENKILKKFRTNITVSVNSLSKNENKIINCNTVSVTNKSIKELKTKYSTLNMDTVFDGLKLKWEKFKKLSSEFKQTRGSSKTPANDATNYESLNSLWTDRYKPSSAEILGNDKVVKKLRNWLQAWKTFDEELKNLAKTSRKNKKNMGEDDDSDDDDSDDDVFVNSDENFGLKAPVSVCLIFGPNGCGKTALVSSLAEELDFNVLEVNASSKRTGKKVLTDFQEATKSHKVQHLSQPQLNGFFKPIRKKKDEKTKKKTDRIKPFEDSTERKISLLLIEDADIVFDEHDEGFYSAVSSLVQTSKRPFIFISDDSHCEQLENFKTDDCLLLEMKRPPFDQACAILDAISLLEGAPIKKETAEFLVLQNNFDLRKSLLDLQFWNGPGEDELKRGQNFDLARFWWGLPRLLYPEETNDALPTVQFKRKRQDILIIISDDEEEIFTKRVKLGSENGDHISLPVADSLPDEKPSKTFELLSSILDAASTLDLMGCAGNKELAPGTAYVPKCSLSLEENMEPVHCMENRLREDLCSELVDCSHRLFSERHGTAESDRSKINFSIPSWDDIRWRDSLDEAREELKNLIPIMNGRDSRSIHLDYLPIIRNICRVEKNRSMTNIKRKNRFVHYFNNSEVQLTEKTLNASCQIFGR